MSGDAQPIDSDQASGPLPVVQGSIKDDRDPGALVVDTFLTEADLDRVLAEDEVSDEDTESLPVLARPYLTEKEDSEIIGQMLQWARVFLFSDNANHRRP